jgi:hypothetical protein
MATKDCVIIRQLFLRKIDNLRDEKPMPIYKSWCKYAQWNNVTCLQERFVKKGCELETYLLLILQVEINKQSESPGKVNEMTSSLAEVNKYVLGHLTQLGCWIVAGPSRFDSTRLDTPKRTQLSRFTEQLKIYAQLKK